MEEDLLHSKKNIVKVIFSFLVIIGVVFVLASYLINDEFRNKIDMNVLGKKVEENLLKTIEINPDSNPHIHAYSRYIAVLNKNVLSIYNQEANEVASLDVNVTMPIMTSNDRYLVVAEKERTEDLFGFRFGN